MNIPGLPAQYAAKMKQRMAERRDEASSHCVKPEDVKKPKEDFFGADKSCHYDHFAMGGGKIDIQMVCKEGPTQTTNIAAPTPQPVTRWTCRCSGGGGEQNGMSMKMHVDAQRVGQCTGKENRTAVERVGDLMMRELPYSSIAAAAQSRGSEDRRQGRRGISQGRARRGGRADRRRRLLGPLPGGRRARRRTAHRRRRRRNDQRRSFGARREPRPLLGILPLGTLNHFARDLGIPTDIDEAAKLIAARQERPRRRRPR